MSVGQQIDANVLRAVTLRVFVLRGRLGEPTENRLLAVTSSAGTRVDQVLGPEASVHRRITDGRSGEKFVEEFTYSGDIVFGSNAGRRDAQQRQEEREAEKPVSCHEEVSVKSSAVGSEYGARIEPTSGTSRTDSTIAGRSARIEGAPLCSRAESSQSACVLSASSSRTRSSDSPHVPAKGDAQPARGRCRAGVPPAARKGARRIRD